MKPRRLLVGLARLAHLSLEELLDDEIALSPRITLYEKVEKVTFNGKHLTYYWKDNLLPSNWQPVNEREHHAPKTIKPSVSETDSSTPPAQESVRKNDLQSANHRSTVSGEENRELTAKRSNARRSARSNAG